MVDRQDIDALLIGALYGELTPADEARLTSHLESHPGDRTALAGLTQARAAVRESRIFAVQLDPPQSVSALLLQEAARRAPRRRAASATGEREEAWFQRFTRSFLAHPAMAAATMLVLVLGVASTMYLRKGDQFADTTAKGETLQPAAPAVTTPTDQTPKFRQLGPTSLAAPTAGSAAAADPAAETPMGGEQRQRHEAAELGRGEASFGVDLADHSALDAADKRAYKIAAPVGSPKPAKRESYLEVRTPQQAPKDLQETQKEAKAQTVDRKVTNDNVDTGAAVGGGAARDQEANGATGSVDGNTKGFAPGHAAPSTPAPANNSPPAVVVAPPKNVETKPAQPTKPAVQTVKTDVASDESLLAWAKDQHARAKQLARAGNCTEVAKLAVTISTRAPDYFAQTVLPDRELKQCMAYINDARNSDAEKSAKLRSQKRNAPDDPMPAAPSESK